MVIYMVEPDPTMQRLLCLLLLICLPLQSFALQGRQLLSADIAHELQHEHGVHHHHDDDGAIYYDTSDESLEHALDHAGSSTSVWSDGPGALCVPLIESVSAGLPEPPRFIPDRWPDCPHRPPSSALG
jgi:hypothetical protein